MTAARSSQLAIASLILAIVGVVPSCQPMMTALAMSPFGWPFGFTLNLPAPIVMAAGLAEIAAIVLAVKARKTKPAKVALLIAITLTALFAIGNLFLMAAAIANR